MKRTFTLIILFALALTSFAQQQKAFVPKISLKWAPTGLILGSISLHGEYNFMGKNSLTAKIGIPTNTKHTFEYQGKDARFNMKATSFLAGYRLYLSKKHLKGLYFEPYFKYVHHTAEGVGTGTLGYRQVEMNFTNAYDGFGVGGQLGFQFLIGQKFVIDLFFLGPEINSAKNNFNAVEASNTIPWTAMEASDAERDILEFLDKFPFIRNNTDVMVDRQNKSVTAFFKGALPGYRLGVSFGIAL
jgi:hypothetical protein